MGGEGWVTVTSDLQTSIHEGIFPGSCYMRVYKIHADLDSELEICISSI